MKFILGVIFVLLMSVNITADDRGFDVVLKEMKSEPRVALVIGNKDYTSLNSLKNPINDARAMKDILEEKNFKVIYLENASQIEMEDAIDKFGNRLKSGNGVGLFYYAGHGIEVDGINYLVPTNARISSKKYVKSKSVATDIIVSAMEEAKNRINILILDSCRNNPFSRGGSGGLAPINSATGIYVAYATAPNKVAEDGGGENGLFTSYLIKYIKQAGLKIEDVFKKVRTKVREESNGNQVPWSSSSVEGDFYFTLPTKKSTQVVKTSSLKWMEIPTSVCKANNGLVGLLDDKDCMATWTNAIKICHSINGKLPAKYELENIISECGGILNNTTHNLHNDDYHSCHKKQGLYSSAYWSYTPDGSRDAWYISFATGSEDHQFKELSISFKCIKD